jgi:hypothetical protein
MAGGKVIGGIVLIILGIIFFGPSHWANTATYFLLERCNSLTGEPGQGLYQGNYQYCENMIIVNSISFVGMIVGGIFVIIGLVFVIIGAIRGKQDKKKVKEIKDSNINANSSKELKEIRGEEKKAAQLHMPVPNTDIPIIENNNNNNNNNDYLSRLEKLAEIKKNGIITQEEFNILKVDIIKKFGNAASIKTTTTSNSKVTNNDSNVTTKDA